MAGTSITQKLKMLMEVGLDKKSKIVLKNELTEVLLEANKALGQGATQAFKELAQAVNDAFKKMGKPELSLDVDKLMGDKNRWKILANSIVNDFVNAFDGLGTETKKFGDDFAANMTNAIDIVGKKLDVISDKLSVITNKIGGSGKAINVSPFIKSIDEIDNALRRMGNSADQLNNVFNFGKEISSIAKLEHELLKLSDAMHEADFKTLPWEEQYAMMAKFMSGYQTYTQLIQQKSGKRHKVDPSLVKTHDTILPVSNDITNMLINIMNRKSGKSLVGYDNNNDGPWGKESTLQEVRDILKEGIKIKGDSKSKSGTTKRSSGKNNQVEDDGQPPTPSYHAMSRSDATKYITDNYNYDLWEDWYTRSDGDARAKIADILEKDRELRNAALNQMWDDYKAKTGSDVGFDEFLNTPVPMYRGVGKDSATTGALSFSLNKETAMANAEDAASIIEVLMKPIDTLGMARPLLKPSKEAEVMIMPDKLAQYQSKTINTSEQLITKAEVEAAEAECRKLEVKANEIEKHLNETKKSVEILKKSTQTYRFGSSQDLSTEKKVAQQLLKPHNAQNKKYSRSQYIIDQLKAGATLTNPEKGKYSLKRDDNGTKVTAELTKTEYEYGQFLSEQIEKLGLGWDKGLEKLQEIRSARLRKEQENLTQEQALYDTVLAAQKEAINKQIQIQDNYNKQQAKIVKTQPNEVANDTANLKKMVDNAAGQNNVHGQALTEVSDVSPSIPDGDIDAQLLAIFKELSNKGGQLVAQDDTLRPIKEVLDQIQINTAKIGDSGSVGGKPTDVNPHYLTDPQGRIVEAYRGISDVYSGLVSDTGRTWSSTDLDLAERAAGASGKVEKVYLTMKNPLEIDAHGSQWDSIEYLGRGETETSEQLLELAQERLEYERQIVEMRKRGASEDEITGVMADLAYTEEMISSLYDDKYGVKTTNEWMDYAKISGHDGIIIKNVYDDLDHPSDIMGTFEADQLHYIETLPMTFERVINLLKQDLPNVEKYINMSADDIAQTMSQLADINNKFDAGEIGINEYEEFLRKNPIVNDLEELVNYGQSVFTPIVSDYIVDDRYNDDIIEALTRVQTFINAKKAEFGIHTTPQEAVGQSTVMPDHTPTSQTHDNTLETAPWAKDTTVQEIRNILKNGIKVKGGSGKQAGTSSKTINSEIDMPGEVSSLIHALKNTFGIKQADADVIQNAALDLFKHAQTFKGDMDGSWMAKTQELINQFITQLMPVIPTEQTTNKDNPYADMKDYLKGKVIYVSDATYKGLDENTQKFVNSSRRFTRKQGDGLAIDSLWEEWSAQKPDFFDPNTINAIDQVEDLVTLLKVAKSWKPTTGYADQLNESTQNDIQNQIVNVIDGAFNEWLNNSTKNDATSEATTLPEDKTTLKTKISQLRNMYMALGKFEAQAEGDPTNKVAEAKRQNVENLIKAKTDELGLDKEQLAVLQQQLDETKNLAKANEEAVVKAKREQKDYKQQVKESRDTVRVNRASSVLNAGRNTFESLQQIDIDQTVIDAIPEVQNLNVAINQLEETRNRINRNGGIVSTGDAEQLGERIVAVKQYDTAVKQLLSNYNKLDGDNAELVPGLKYEDTQNLIVFKNQMREAAMAATDGKIQIKEFDMVNKTVTGTVKTGTHELTEMTIAVRDLDNSYVKLTGKTKRAETFFEASKRKLSQISSYFSAMSLINKGTQEFKKGLQYIREIDSALTELRKVTDETEESYENFVDTAAKTADKVGSTIKDVVSSTADWARLSI